MLTPSQEFLWAGFKVVKSVQFGVFSLLSASFIATLTAQHTDIDVLPK